MSSDEDGSELMAAFKKKDDRKLITARPKSPEPAAFSPGNFISDDGSGGEEHVTTVASLPKSRRAVCVRPSPIRNKHNYTYYEPQDEVHSILREFTRKGEIMCQVRLWNDKSKVVSETLNRK